MNKWPKVRHKFNAQRTKYNGISFDSKKEANYYLQLIVRVKAKEILFFLRQVPFDLPGGVKYKADFMEFWSNGTVHIVDVKGIKTKDFIMKKKMVESLYPVTIEII